MSENDRLSKLKESYSKGIIDLDEFERELARTIGNFDDLNTDIGLRRQVWMSQEKSNNPDPTKLKPVGENQMHLMDKPTGGMWTSSYTPEDIEYDSDWIRWCSSEGFYGGRYKWLLKPKPDIRVLVIDSIDDFKTLMNCYNKDTYKGKNVSDLSDNVIDFEKIAEDFDAIRLTKKGLKETRYNPLDENVRLYSWDSESVLSFRWNWISYEYLGYCDQEVTTYGDVPN